MIVLLTGFSGLLGSAVGTALVAAGHHVKGVVHRRAYGIGELPEGVELIWGDLERRTSITDGVTDADAVVHCAWEGRQDPLERYIRNNVDGSVELLRSAIAAGVDKFIHISSVSVYGSDPRSDGSGFDEWSPIIAEDDPLDVYPRTKALLERRLREEVDGSDTALNIVRPGLLYGPGKPPAKRLVARGGRSYALLFGGSENHLPYIHVDDVASLVVRCLEPDAPSVVNAVPTRALSSYDFATRWASQQDADTGVARLPLPVARSVALATYRAKVALGRPALRPNVAYQMTTATRNVRYDSALATSLGWSDTRTSRDRGDRPQPTGSP